MTTFRKNVFKKSSPNLKLSVYLGRRDFFDDLKTTDSIEGLVLLDDDYLRDKKIFARIECSFRYGREDSDSVINGVVFKKEFFIESMQIYPSPIRENRNLTLFQDRLLNKFPANGIPFQFVLPHDIPSSIMLIPHHDEHPNNQPCGIQYYLTIFEGADEFGEIEPESCVSVMIRRFTTAMPDPTKPVYIERSRAFHLHSGAIKIQATLSKEVFFHGESIPLKVMVDNLSSNTVKRIKIQVIQITEITLFRPKVYRAVVHTQEIPSGPYVLIEANKTEWSHQFKLRPILEGNRHKVGLALDGKMKHQDTNLASSTLIKDYRKKEVMGIIANYKIRIKIVTGFGGRDSELEIPIVLTHPSMSLEKMSGKEEIIIQKFSRPKVSIKSQNSINHSELV